MDVSLYIPRWFYPNNLGDSFHSFFAPKVLKHENKEINLTVVTCGELLGIMSKNPYVDAVREPLPNEIGTFEQWKEFSFRDTTNTSAYSIVAEWHPKV